jgi:hypothetical protein
VIDLADQIASYDAMFSRSRRHAENEPPRLYQDICGYEYAGFYPGMSFTCCGCGENHVAQMGVTANVHVAFTDMTQAFGRRHTQLGTACGEACADMMFERWEAARV